MNIFRSHRLIGVVFLALMVGSVWFTYAIFSNKFTAYDRVTLQTSSIGLQMPVRADVKYRGVRVGEVLEFKPTSQGADVTLGLFPDQVDTIPADVTGAILPKTLFGEKFVSLESAGGNPAVHIKTGDVVRRTAVATEVEQVLSDLLPLLRTVEPEQLNYTLNAFAAALEGRGTKLGGGLTTLDSYLKRLNPELDALVADVRKTAQVSDLYADVVPELAEVLRNTVVTGHTLEDREAKLQKLFADVSAFSGTAESFLDANGDNLIRLGELTSIQMKLFARYAPEYPCLIQGIANEVPRIDQTLRGHMLHIDAELLPHQPRGYDVGDTPINGDTRGPHCGTLPNPPFNQQHKFLDIPNANDGVERPTGKGTRRVAPAGLEQPYVGTAAEAGLLRSLLSPVFGVSADDVPDLAVLMVAPMARGSEVSVR
jgi:phospholipid/cholesterol/gamma-HCH transport system substrate-binding protein